MISSLDDAHSIDFVQKPCLQPFAASPDLTYAEGTILFKQGAPARDVFLLEQGLVKIIFLDPGGEAVIIELATLPGTLIGDSCSILGRHAVSAAVVTRHARLRRIAAGSFSDLVRHNAEMSWQLHRAHCLQHAELLDRAAQLGYLSVRKRIEQLLWKLSQAVELIPTAKGLRMQLPLKYRELAQLVAVSPEHLCRVLGMIEKDGLIRREKGWIYLSDRDRLFRVKNL